MNALYLGEFPEMIRRTTSDGFSLLSDDNWDYFASLQEEWSAQVYLLGAVGLVAILVAVRLIHAAVTVMTTDELRGHNRGVAATMRCSLRRVPRLVGVDFQVIGIGLVVLVLLRALNSRQLLPEIVVLLVLLLLGAMAALVLSLAYSVASIGPARGSLAYAVRLTRGRFWPLLGRLLLVSFLGGVLVYILGSIVDAIQYGSFSLWLGSTVVFMIVSVVVQLWVVAANTLVYLDAGGEVDPRIAFSGEPSEGETDEADETAENPIA